MTKQIGRVDLHSMQSHAPAQMASWRSTWHAPGPSRQEATGSGTSATSFRYRAVRHARQRRCNRRSGRSSATTRRVRPRACGRRRGRRPAPARAAARARGHVLSRTRGRVPGGAGHDVADRIDALDSANFAGVTTFPALLFDHETHQVRPTPNLATLERAVAELRRAGRATSRSTRPVRRRLPCSPSWRALAPPRSSPATDSPVPRRCTP